MTNLVWIHTCPYVWRSCAQTPCVGSFNAYSLVGLLSISDSDINRCCNAACFTCSCKMHQTKHGDMSELYVIKSLGEHTILKISRISCPVKMHKWSPHKDKVSAWLLTAWCCLHFSSFFGLRGEAYFELSTSNWSISSSPSASPVTGSASDFRPGWLPWATIQGSRVQVIENYRLKAPAILPLIST